MKVLRFVTPGLGFDKDILKLSGLLLATIKYFDNSFLPVKS